MSLRGLEGDDTERERVGVVSEAAKQPAVGPGAVSRINSELHATTWMHKGTQNVVIAVGGLRRKSELPVFSFADREKAGTSGS